MRAFLTTAGDRVINEFSAAAAGYIRGVLESLSDEELREALTGLGRINASAQRLGLWPEREIPVSPTA